MCSFWEKENGEKKGCKAVSRNQSRRYFLQKAWLRVSKLGGDLSKILNENEFIDVQKVANNKSGGTTQDNIFIIYLMLDDCLFHLFYGTYVIMT